MLPLEFPHLSATGIWFMNLAVGFGFGAVLEASGFGDSRRLAAQFYLRDMTVLKVMFGAIITAATLIVLGNALGLVEFGRLYVNYTYLWPQIAGGLIMGVGFIVGGFCPGTSVVAASTLKIDGMVFLLGVAFGIFLFGESVPLYEKFYESGAMGRFTVADWLSIDLGWALLGVVLFALLLFYAGELAEAVFGKGQAWKDVRLMPSNRGKIIGATIVTAAALLAALLGQPDSARRWKAVQAQAAGELFRREVQVHPGEVIELEQNPSMEVTILDLRPEADFNLFHLKGAWNVDPQVVPSREFQRRLAALHENSVVFLISNSETVATASWKELRGLHIPNIYLVEDGYRGWLKFYPPEPCIVAKDNSAEIGYRFLRAVGEHSFAAHPDCACRGEDIRCPGLGVPSGHAEKKEVFNFAHKVKVTVRGAKKGGCG